MVVKRCLYAVCLFLGLQPGAQAQESKLSKESIGIGRASVQFLPNDNNAAETTLRSPHDFLNQSEPTRAENSDGKRAIVVGASSGMGRAVAKLLAADGYTVGLAARRLNLLQDLQQEIATPTFVKQIDAAQATEAAQKLEELIGEMGGLDLLVVSVTSLWGVDWNDRNISADKSILDVDIVGFHALARTGLNFFEKQGHGHFVGFSSIDGLRGVAGAPAYSAAKAFASRFMEAERNRYLQKKLPIFVTELVPGWINSADDPNFTNPKAYWIDSLHDAARDIFEAIKNKTPVAYITKRWEQVAQMLKVMPDELYNALGGL